MDPAPWRSWPDVTVSARRLPAAATLIDLYKFFSPHGNIITLDLFADKSGNHHAKARFEPPPSSPFWSQQHYTLNYGDNKSARISLSLLTPQRIYFDLIPSPADPKKLLKKCMSIKVEQMDFAVRIRENGIMIHKSVRGNVRVDVNLEKKNLTIAFELPFANLPAVGYNADQEQRMEQYRCTVEFSRLKTLFQVPHGDSATALIMPMEYPALFQSKKDDESLSKIEGKSFWSTSDMWQRRTVILNSRRLFCSFPITLQADFDDAGFINLGRWTTFRFIVGNSSNDLNQVLDALQAFNIGTANLDEFEAVPARPALLSTHHRVKTETNATGGLSLESLASTLDAPPALDFQVHYQLEVCISRGIFSEYAITREFVARLRDQDKDRARWTLEFFADKGHRVWDPMDIFDDEEAAFYFPNPMMPHYCSTIRKIIVTPTTAYYGSPSVESSNRVLRKYSQYHDRFIRVQFTDELYRGKIFGDSGDEIFYRIYAALSKGITIGSRRYEFLAFGNSQIRECAVYFFCPTDHLNCDQIRGWMGHFSHIRNVAKHAARIGQCFSTTREIRGVTVPNIVPTQDVERNGYCFSDGVGKISKLLAEMVVQEMGGDDLNNVPSAFQFRMGGCKGMLAMWPDAKGLEVHIRPSQEKFKSRFNGLEIIKYAQHSPATLNRQTIIVLTSLGVRPEVILKLADQQIQNYQKAMSDRVAAATLLAQHIDENQTSLTIKDLVGWGFIDPEIQEPFVLTILDLWRIWSMKLLKEKARVVVDESAFLLGCLDETGTLRGHSNATEGKKTRNIEDLPQVFLQILKPGSKKKEVIKGLCIVGRNPSLHPGDVRVVEAVEVPALQHLTNVVVFPSTGDRDVPSMLSGGDLDGDDFFVMWNPDLIPSNWHEPPMNYAQPKPPILGRDVRVKDLRTFFVRFMQNDSVARIATAHLAHADKSPLGVKDRRCLKLAELHSKAVDYVKTGDAAKLPTELDARERPHFMQKNSRRTYTSSTALGKLYDMIQDVGFSPLYQKSFDTRVLNRYTLTDDMVSKARAIKAQYDTAMRRLMGQRDVETEFEIWTGFVLTKPRVGSDYKQQEDVGRESATLKQRFRDICYNEAGGRDFENIAPFVAAMYRVTEEEVNAALAGEYEDDDHKRRSMPLISFPWIFHWIMGRIATGQVKAKPTVDLEAAAPPMARMSGPIRREEAEQETQINDGRVVHRGEDLRVFPSPNDDEDNKRDEYSVSSGNVDLTSREEVDGEEIHVEDEEEDGMDMLMAMGGDGDAGI
ncbi:RNA-dependent RNA polymerase 1 [Colletotrichum orbiculare MAFF 240422]|uniref:RNA-dependent RNA polymerase n=1 Tax=Colletotrichum orbiculare (strain 104-T / ATCC 96160 / CBS 514.97 / LARS 414 / MAFF 240422) TaxID=1213857 RepID=N4VIB0_COLOR|nr:RNA-dependent RNA polymerase 1 [Colletotrichum orbiculare MAFF 240422]